MTNVPLPPMTHNLWGTPQEEKPLSPSIQKMLTKILGKNTRQVPRIPAAKVQLSPVRLKGEHLDALAQIVGTKYVTWDHEQRLRRARGKSYPDLLDFRTTAQIDAPDAVVAPRDEEEILALLQYCSRMRIAVVTFGGGTSVVGGITPKSGEMQAVISVDMCRFDGIEDVDQVSGLVTLGAGLSGPAAEMLLREHGLQLGHFPQSFPYASIGGFAATRSSGQNSAGYGRFDEMVRALTLVTPQGIMRVGGGAPASAAGPDLRQLVLGSEGIFGIITKVRLRVHPIPQTKRYEAFSFPTFKAGVAAVRAVTQHGTGPTVIRLSDEVESAVNLTSTDKIGQTSKNEGGCLCLTMFEGTYEHAESRHRETRDLLLKMGGTSQGEGPVRKWEQGRFGAPVLRDALLDAGAICETLETATDWANALHLRQAVVEALGKNLGTPALIMCHVSHVYPTGCSLYFTVVAGQSDNPHDQWWKAKEATCSAITAAGGTISHHHGVGTDHRPYMGTEVGDLGIKMVAAVKEALDPAGIMNPGKLI
ncbi:MAG: FAD-binding oxidoreductase [Actinomycetaceae bacterium]|nr:FAD-binding oxidoreductase [Actinomycetaceae bacterium]